MNWKRDKECFDNLCKNYSSKYEAIQALCEDARHKMKQAENVISESQGLTWALTGIEPDYIEQRIKLKAERENAYKPVIYYQEEYMNELLSLVDDEDICESVRQSFKESKATGHLLYVYINHISDGNKARVRILTNLVWHFDASEKYE